jgi:hypothetical protein
MAWLWRGNERRESRPGQVHAAEDRRVAAEVTGAARKRPSVRAGMALHAELREEVVELPSGVIVDGIDMDRAWVCAGEPVALSARVGGEAEPGVVYRWLWRHPGGVELHPGPAMHWRAPAATGTYVVRFQACKDLGGRRVGVLAESEVSIEVRACTAGESQDSEPLRVRVVQRRHGAFAFHAVYRGRERVEAYQWDLGDGTAESTAEPMIEHAYATHDLGPHETRSAVVMVKARLAGGELLEAMAVVMVRGQPEAHDRPAVELDIGRWQPRLDGRGWDSELSVHSPESEITWDRLERTTRYFDGREEVATRAWTDVIRVDETLASGGFRGVVRVESSEVPLDVKQIIDVLYGHDSTGNEIMTSWSPFKRESPEPVVSEPIPGK